MKQQIQGDVLQVGGGGTKSPLTKTTASVVQKEIIKLDNSIERTKGVIDSYRGDYQTIGKRWGSRWDAFKEKSGIGSPLTGEDKKELAAFSTYRKRAVKDLGLAIHDLAGSTVSKNEEALFTAGLPNPGTGLIDGDSPTPRSTRYPRDEPVPPSRYRLRRARHMPRPRRL